MARIVTTENPSREVARYLRHYTHSEFIEPRIALLHPGLAAAARRKKARAAALSIRQGLEYLESATASSVLTKPLPLFYAAENLNKALVLVNHPTLDASDFKAHGLSGDKSKRYSARNLLCTVGKPGSDVWSRVFALANGDRIQASIRENGVPVRRDWWSGVTAPALPPKTQIVLGDLLRRLPELVDDLNFAGWKQSYMVHVRDYSFVHNDGPPVTESMNMTLRHGHHLATKAMVIAAEHKRDLLLGWTRTHDTLDILSYSKHTSGTPISIPNIRLDAFGEMYVEMKTGTYYGEILVYHAALFILSDVVRYQVEQWKRLLDDHPSEQLLVERFLEIGVRKLPNLLLNELAGELYEFKFAR
jgi:hypothetical protein